MKTVKKTVITHYCEHCGSKFAEYESKLCISHEKSCKKNPNRVEYMEIRNNKEKINER